MSSPDLRAWTTPVDPLPTLPSWASAGLTWAPGVLRIRSRYVMYYTVHDSSLGRQCISVATSDDPQGPFTDSSSQPLVCQTGDGGSIDPNPYLDASTGVRYLLWKSDDNSLGAGHPTHIWGQPLAPDGTSFAGGTTPSLLLAESAPWQAPTAEGPTVIEHAGRYYLFYGANNYDTASSGIGYAISTSTLLGAYTNESVSRPWTASTGSAQGPQGPMIFTDAFGTTGWRSQPGMAWSVTRRRRSLWIGTLSFSRFGTPTLN